MVNSIASTDANKSSALSTAAGTVGIAALGYGTGAAVKLNKEYSEGKKLFEKAAAEFRTKFPTEDAFVRNAIVEYAKDSKPRVQEYFKAQTSAPNTTEQQIKFAKESVKKMVNDGIGRVKESAKDLYKIKDKIFKEEPSFINFIKNYGSVLKESPKEGLKFTAKAGGIGAGIAAAGYLAYKLFTTNNE